MNDNIQKSIIRVRRALKNAQTICMAPFKELNRATRELWTCVYEFYVEGQKLSKRDYARLERLFSQVYNLTVKASNRISSLKIKILPSIKSRKNLLRILSLKGVVAVNEQMKKEIDELLKA